MMAYLQLKLISIDTLFIPIDGTLILITCWQFHVILTPFSSDVSFCIGIATKLENRGNSDAKIHQGNGEMENSCLRQRYRFTILWKGFRELVGEKS